MNELQDKLHHHAFASSHKGLGYIGYYKNSKAIGNFWAGMYGGRPTGHLHGTVSAIDGTITGSNIMYIYPDMETALLGAFEDRKMKDAQESTVLDLDCDRNGLYYVSQYSIPKLNSPHFYYEPPSNISFGAGPPNILDPYERKWLELRAAGHRKIGEGVFTKRHIKPYTLVSSYNGFIYDKLNGESELYSKRCTMNSTKTDNARRHCKKYSIGLSSKHAKIEIPPEFDQPESFIPSFGPKVNKMIRWRHI